MTNDYTKMTDPELNAEVARRRGWKGIFDDRGYPPGIAVSMTLGPEPFPAVATDLNEAVKLPDYLNLHHTRGGNSHAMVRVGWETGYCNTESSPARSVVLAFLAADDAKGVGDGN